MAWMNWSPLKNRAAALLAAAALAAPAAAQLYEHPKARWRIDFPAGWRVAERTRRGAEATPPAGHARLVVSKRLTAATVVRGVLRCCAPLDRRRYGAARVLIDAEVTLRGHAGRRVEFEFKEPGSGRAMKAWRTILVENGVADEVSIEAAAVDY